MTEDQRKLAEFQISEVDSAMKEKDYQRAFFESLYTQFEEKGFLSPNQMACLNRMYERVTA